MTIIDGICQYLVDRNISVNLYNDYIEIHNEGIIISLSGDLVYVTLLEPQSVSGLSDNIAIFDIADPTSLHAIYECIVKFSTLKGRNNV